MTEIRTVDMVVIGTGASGLVAALVARSRGLDPLVIEKADVVGGTSAFSGGVLWIPDNPVMRAAGAEDSFENGMTYLDAVVGDEGPATSKARKTAFLREGPRMVQFLLDLGIEFNYSDGYPDYYPHLPGGHTRGRGINTVHFDLVRLGAWEQWVRPNPKNGIKVNLLMKSLSEGPPMTRPLTSLQGPKMTLRVGSRTALAALRGKNTRAMGQALVAHLLYQAQRLGIHFWLSSPMQNLITEDGKVVGVRVRRAGRDIDVRATHGVVLAAGGFARNDVMRKQFHPQPSASEWSVASPDDNGDGITAGMEHGAVTSLMDESVWVPISMLPDGTSMINLWERSLPHSIIVDAAGNRFCNEAGSYMDICQLAYERHNEATAIPSWLIIDARHRRLYPFGLIPPGYTPKSYITSGYMKKASSIEGIASACGIDPSGLRKTVERFNRMAEAGIDEDFHRGENAYDAHYGEPKHKPNPCLGALSTPPFYAVAIYPGDCGTSGGLLTDEHGQVLGHDGKPLGGLYAAGVNAAPVLGRKYPAAGASLGPVTVSGFIAGSHIATQAQRAG